MRLPLGATRAKLLQWQISHHRCEPAPVGAGPHHPHNTNNARASAGDGTAPVPGPGAEKPPLRIREHKVEGGLCGYIYVELSITLVIYQALQRCCPTCEADACHSDCASDRRMGLSSTERHAGTAKTLASWNFPRGRPRWCWSHRARGSAHPVANGHKQHKSSPGLCSRGLQEPSQRTNGRRRRG
jgi:hypothetical protein